MANRITSGMMIDTYTKNLHANQKRMSNYQSQLATNRKLVRLSDDPVSVIKIVNAKSKLSDIEQYQKNLRDADAWLTQTETALNEMNEIVKRGYELAVYAANDSLEADDRSAIGKELTQLRDQVLTLANSSLGDKFIFGGYNTTSEPFSADFETGDVLLNGVSMVDDDGDLEFMQYQINFGIDFDIAISGSDFLGVGEENNAFYLFHKFSETVNNPESVHSEIQPFIESMKTIQKNALAQLAEVGGRLARVKLMETRFAQDNINYTQMCSDSEDVDQAETIMNFSMTEAVYRAALNVGGRVLQPTLVDFLR